MGVSVEQMVGDEVDRMEIKYCGICQILNCINIIFCMLLKRSQKWRFHPLNIMLCIYIDLVNVEGNTYDVAIVSKTLCPLIRRVNNLGPCKFTYSSLPRAE